MYLLLIVDDEPGITEGLAENIDWESAGFGSVMTATSGYEALEIIRTYSIDVVLADIRMPDMTGLELAERIRTSASHTKTIMLSAYRDFGYAQSAIATGVVDYLVKPVSNQEVRDSVEKALEVVKKQRSEKARSEIYSRQIEESRPLLRSQFLKRWLRLHTMSFNAVVEKIRELELPIHPDWPAVLVMLNIRKYPEPCSEKQKEFLRQRMMEEFSLRMMIHRNSLSFSTGQNRAEFLIQRENQKLLLSFLHDLSIAQQEFLEYAERTLRLQIRIDWGPIVEPEHLPESYRYMEEKNASEKTVYGNAPHGEPVSLPPKIFERPELSELLEIGHSSAVMNRIREIVFEVGEQQYSSPIVMKEIHQHILGSLVVSSNRLGISASSWIEWEIIEKPFPCTAVELAKRISDYESLIGGFSKFIAKSRQDRSHVSIQRTKQYLIDHLGEDVDLAQMADAAFLHPHYLSSLFTKMEGISPIGYLTRLRVERAKHLLRDPGLSITDIAEAVGYGSSSHFSKIFKKWTGKTPNKYRSQFLRY